MKISEKLRCEDCGSDEIAVECLVIQGPDRELEVTCVMDDGRMCNDCGSENIEPEVTT